MDSRVVRWRSPEKKWREREQAVNDAFERLAQIRRASKTLLCIIGGYPSSDPHVTLLLARYAHERGDVDVILVDPVADWDGEDMSTILNHPLERTGIQHIKKPAREVDFPKLFGQYRDVAILDQLEGRAKGYSEMAEKELPPVWEWVNTHPKTTTYWIVLHEYHLHVRRVVEPRLGTVQMSRLEQHTVFKQPVVHVRDMLKAHRDHVGIE